jgi:F0F1-type ATP synthase membrane subunit c/vacuolar-type H+-ATPase subunit K
MSTEVATAFAQALTILTMPAAAIGEAWVISSAFKAMGRNPKLENTLFSKVIIAVALVESTAIYAFVAFFLL